MKLTNKNFLSQTPQPEKARKLNIIAWILTAVVILLVAFMHRISLPALPGGITLNSLTLVNAFINSAVAVALILAMVFIKQRNFVMHRNMMTTALVLSVLFLLSYVAYHITHEDVKYGDANWDGTLDESELLAVAKTRTLYLVLLISHIVLAAVTFPFILFTFIRAFTNQFRQHVKMAKWLFPLWLYVAVTGPIIYLLLRPYYPY